MGLINLFCKPLFTVLSCIGCKLSVRCRKKLIFIVYKITAYLHESGWMCAPVEQSSDCGHTHEHRFGSHSFGCPQVLISDSFTHLHSHESSSYTCILLQSLGKVCEIKHIYISKNYVPETAICEYGFDLFFTKLHIVRMILEKWGFKGPA
jgi:hypothetical protein